MAANAVYRYEEDVICSAVLIYFKLKKRKRRSEWTKQWLLRRYQHTHANLLEDLRVYPLDFKNYLRMEEDVYLQLLQMVRPLIEKSETNMRQSISPHERLTATLRFLATGRNYEDMKFATCISPQCLGRIIPEVCQAIFESLSPEYLKVSTSFHSNKRKLTTKVIFFFNLITPDNILVLTLHNQTNKQKFIFFLNNADEPVTLLIQFMVV